MTSCSGVGNVVMAWSPFL